MDIHGITYHTSQLLDACKESERERGKEKIMVMTMENRDPDGEKKDT